MDKHKDLLEACDAVVHKHELTYSLAYLEKPTWVVYFLVEQDKIVYIGESYKPLSRLLSHAKEGKKQFDKAYYKILPKYSNTRLYEAMCMSYLGEPTKYNVLYKFVSADVNPLTNLAQ
jgi:hypothetical protein